MTLSVDWMAVATAAAAVAGPLIAIWVTRMSDGRREVTSRRMEIFRTLMRTRRMPIHYDHVAALNLVEIEFSGCQTVIAAWREYLRNLSERLSEPNDFDARTAFSKRREALLTKLIHEIALTLNRLLKKSALGLI
ncbi:hypothetical protein EBL89_18480 [Cereibacter sphaeroides]|uniref:DUF6680 family protein n=1 Tax=Cereibacter sphaeroides TaxID=1063 RepID=UPI000F541D87|nr:DUF6680 family protein [Cereibacter sphaeroides]AZB57275.1 hypothetical protein EBL89_18480 [Cereibacter sphaeroides]